MVSVVKLPDNRQVVTETRKLGDAEGRRRRLAIQIAAQLPEDAAEALMVLEAATCLVRTFLVEGSA